MHVTTRDIIIKILTIIEYDGNKEEFAHKLIDMFHRQAVLDVIESIPKENQELLKKQLSGNITPEMEKTLILQHVTPDKYLEALKKSAQNILSEYLKSITPVLSPKQSAELQTYLNFINPKNH